MTGPQRAPAGWCLQGPHGEVPVQALGAMLGPLVLRLPGGQRIAPLYRAPWHGETGPALDDNALLRHLQGEWLCAPYGPAAPPTDLPPGWSAREAAPDDPDAGCDHGWAAQHRWTQVESGPDHLRLAIEPPAGHVLARIERRVHLAPDAPRVEVVTTLHPRRDARLPLALHPTFALPAAGVELLRAAGRAVHAYPVAPVPGVSRLRPGARSADLSAVPGVDGALLDLRRLPLPGATEELLQVEDARPPWILRTAADDGALVDLELDWNADVLPDVLVWISQGGRSHAPWNGRNRALGIEPCASCFDLTRVAEPAPDHALAHRRGVALAAGRALALRWSLHARLAPSA